MSVLLSYMSLSTIYNKDCYATVLLWLIYVASNNKAYLGLHVKRPIFLYAANNILDILEKCSSKSQISNCKEIHPVWAALMQTDRRTDMTKLMGSFRAYANTPRNHENFNQNSCSQGRNL